MYCRRSRRTSGGGGATRRRRPATPASTSGSRWPTGWSGTPLGPGTRSRPCSARLRGALGLLCQSHLFARVRVRGAHHDGWCTAVVRCLLHQTRCPSRRRDMDNTQLQPGAVVPLLAAGGQRQDAAAEAADKRPAKEGKQKHKHKNKDKEKKSSRKQLQKKTASMATSDLDRLRAERRQREATERSRQLQMLRQTHRT